VSNGVAQTVSAGEPGGSARPPGESFRPPSRPNYADGRFGRNSSVDVASLIAASIAALAAIVTVVFVVRDRKAATRDRLVGMADLVEEIRLALVIGGSHSSMQREDVRRRLR
jgi:hypothetical protein